MRRRLLAAGLALWLAGCATAPPPAVPATRTLEGAPAVVLEEAMALLMARGYVIRHADAELGRLEAVIARWPGYRLRLRVAPAEAGSRLSITAHRGDRPLPPALAEPLIAALDHRLSASP